MRYLLSKEPKLIETKRYDGMPALTAAVLSQKTDVVKFFVENLKIPVDSEAWLGAFEYADIKHDLVEYFLYKLTTTNNLSMIDAKNNDGWTALSKAASAGDVYVVDLLVDHGATIDLEALSCAIYAATNRYQPNIEVARHLLQKDRRVVNYQDEDGETPLKIALNKERNRHIVKLLVDYGANIDSEAWFMAVKSGDRQVVGALLEGKPDIINVQNEYKETALSMAMASWRYNKAGFVKFLVDHGADVNSEIWFEAVGEDKPNLKILGYLLDGKPEIINEKNDEEATALSLAIYKDKTGLVKLLVDRGANIDRGDWFMAAKSEKKPNLEILGYLLDKKPELINEKNYFERTALSEAAFAENQDLVKFLLDRGAVVDSDVLLKALRFSHDTCDYTIVDWLLNKNPNI